MKNLSKFLREQIDRKMQAQGETRIKQKAEDNSMVAKVLQKEQAENTARGEGALSRREEGKSIGR